MSNLDRVIDDCSKEPTRAEWLESYRLEVAAMTPEEKIGEEFAYDAIASGDIGIVVSIMIGQGSHSSDEIRAMEQQMKIELAETMQYVFGKEQNPFTHLKIGIFEHRN